MRNLIVRWLSLVPLRRVRPPSGTPQQANPSAAGPRPSPFRAVELRTQGAACRGAKALAGKRILASEAPALPLPGCLLRCTCQYKSHADRRSAEPRRLADVGVSGTFYTGPERRSGLDRRIGGRGIEDNYYDYMRRRD